MNKDRLEPCTDCGGEEYDESRDGLTVTFSCGRCGTFIAELIENVET